MQSTRTCSIEGCSKPAVSRGWCEKHYSRWKRHGDPNVVKLSREKHLCSVEGCERDARSLGLCRAHWTRLKKSGDVQENKPVRTVLFGGNIEDRLWRFVDRSDNSSCWIWTRAIQPNGYGTINWDGKSFLAHRVAYDIPCGTGTPIDSAATPCMSPGPQ